MYGKLFASTFTGSMMGAGADVFAVWGYVIANVVDSQIELNPKFLAATIGMTVKRAEKAIEYLCRPDEESRSKDDEGCRLVKEGQFAYRVPSHRRYQNVRNEEQRREYNRAKMAESRKRKAEAESVKSQAVESSGMLPTVTNVIDKLPMLPMCAYTDTDTEANTEADTNTKAKAKPRAEDLLVLVEPEAQKAVVVPPDALPVTFGIEEFDGQEAFEDFCRLYDKSDRSARSQNEFFRAVEAIVKHQKLTRHKACEWLKLKTIIYLKKVPSHKQFQMFPYLEKKIFWQPESAWSDDGKTNSGGVTAADAREARIRANAAKTYAAVTGNSGEPPGSDEGGNDRPRAGPMDSGPKLLRR